MPTCFPHTMHKSRKAPVTIPVEVENADIQLKRDIGDRIASIRRGAGLTARQVAEKVQVKRETLTQIENGRNNPTAIMLWKLACILRCEVSDFFPRVHHGFALTEYDMRRIEKAGDTKAVEWATTIFGKQE